MKLKNYWKRFWTLDRHHAAGFTLVELIVVIAILAILAGVAVPVYSGYVAKAERAADEQLLAAVNTAFAAACAQNGVSHVNLPEKPEITFVEGTKKVDSVSLYNEDFSTFFAGNENSEFKVFEDLYYSKLLGQFVENAVLEYTYGGGTVYLNSEAIEELVASTFLTSSTLNGSAGLLDQVNFVTEIAAGMAGSLEAVWKDPTFTASAMKVLGVTTSEEYIAKQEELIAELMETKGYTKEQAVNQLAANSTVLYAAESTKNFTDEQIKALFSTTGIDEVKSNLKGNDTTTGMAQAALIYGMYTAYAHNSGKSELISNANDPLTVLNALENDKEFIAFVNSEQGKKDMDAYLGTLDMITDTASSSPSAVEHLMVNGFNNEDLKDLIADATGK